MAVVLAAGGCHSGDKDDANYKPDSAILSLPRVPVSQDLSDIFGNDFNGHVVAAFTATGDASGAVAMAADSCALAVKPTTGSIQLAKSRIPTNSDSPINKPSRADVAKAIGPSVSVSMTISSNTLTLYCGTKGAAVGLERAPAKVSTTGSILQVAPGGGVSELELVVASKKTLDSLR